MPLRTAEVMNNEAAVEQELQLCRFRGDLYPASGTRSSRRRILILGGGKLVGELYRVILSECRGQMEVVGFF